MNVIRLGQLIPLGDHPSADEDRSPGWSYFTELIEPVVRAKPPKAAQSYETYIGFRHGQQGLRLTLQASLQAFVLLACATNGPGIVTLVMKGLLGTH